MPTDEEVICEFMVNPREPGYFGEWWTAIFEGQEIQYLPCSLTLDKLREVEERLTESQRLHYCCLMWQHTDAPTANPIENLISRHRFTLLHASAEQKIRALAEVLRQTR